MFRVLTLSCGILSCVVSGLDILALLVSIYGSSDLFIVEYRSLLAEKLLANLKYLTDQEVANLELLKIRYRNLVFCEVMNDLCAHMPADLVRNPCTAVRSC